MFRFVCANLIYVQNRVRGRETTLAEKQIKVTLDGVSEEDVNWKSTLTYTLPLLELFFQRQH